jgi:hypothetical protein
VANYVYFGDETDVSHWGTSVSAPAHSKFAEACTEDGELPFRFDGGIDVEKAIKKGIRHI